MDFSFKVDDLFQIKADKNQLLNPRKPPENFKLYGRSANFGYSQYFGAWGGAGVKGESGLIVCGGTGGTGTGFCGCAGACFDGGAGGASDGAGISAKRAALNTKRLKASIANSQDNFFIEVLLILYESMAKVYQELISATMISIIVNFIPRC